MTSAILINPQQAQAAMSAMYREHIKPGTMAGHRYRLTLKQETRRDSQNAHFHSLIGQISEAIGGDLADAEDAKRILLSAFRIDTLKDFADDWRKIGDIRMGRGLRGEVVLMGNQTRVLSVKLAAAFVEWLNAFGAENGIQFKTPKSWGEGNER